MPVGSSLRPRAYNILRHHQVDKGWLTDPGTSVERVGNDVQIN